MDKRFGVSRAKGKFVVNRNSYILHKLPTREQCNVDQMPERNKWYLAGLKDKWMFTLCKHCFGGKS